MDSSNLDYKTLYKSMKALRDNCQHTYKQLADEYGLSKEQAKRAIDNARESVYQSHRFASDVEGISNQSAKILLHSFSSCVHEIHQTRKMIRRIDKKSGIEEAMYESKSNSYRAFSEAFPSAQIETSCEIGEEISVRELHNSWNGVVEGGASISVPVTWSRKIYDQGISVVKAGDGARFVLDSKERRIARLNNDYIRCWAVRAVKRKNKVCTVENATVMKYDAGGDVVLSISDSFSKAESLIRRRIKDAALDVLMEL